MSKQGATNLAIVCCALALSSSPAAAGEAPFVLVCAFSEPGHEQFTVDVNLSSKTVVESGNGGGEFRAQISDHYIAWANGFGQGRRWDRYTGDLVITIAGMPPAHWNCTPGRKLG